MPDAGDRASIFQFPATTGATRCAGHQTFLAVSHAAASSAAPPQWQDIGRLNAGAIEALRSKGMIVNQAGTSGFRTPLDALSTLKNVYGARAWSRLEASVGKLV